MAAENGGIHEIKSLSDFYGKLEEGQKSGKLVVADFWATDCGPCKAMYPIFERFSGKYDEVTFLKVDVYEHPDVSEQVGIRALPTFMAFRDISKVREVVGANPPALEKLIEKNRGAFLSSIV